MKKKILLITILALSLVACKKDSDYEIGNIKNKDNPTNITSTSEKETNKEETNSESEIETNLESHAEINTENQKVLDFEKSLYIDPHTGKEVSDDIKKVRDKKVKQIERDSNKIKKEAKDYFNEDLPKSSPEIIDQINKKLGTLKENAEKFTIDMIGTDNDVVINVSNYILASQRQEAYELMLDVKAGLKPIITKSLREDGENHAIQITLINEDGIPMTIINGYYNEVVGLISIRNKYNTKEGAIFRVKQELEHGE